MPQLAEASLERSKVVSRDGSGKLDAVRTSSGTFLAKGQDELVRPLCMHTRHRASPPTPKKV